MKTILALVVLAAIGPAAIAVHLLAPAQPAGGARERVAAVRHAAPQFPDQPPHVYPMGWLPGIQPPSAPRPYAPAPPSRDPWNEGRAVLFPRGVWEGPPNAPGSIFHPPGSWIYLGEGVE